MLQVTKTGSRSWVLRTMVGGAEKSGSALTRRLDSLSHTKRRKPHAMQSLMASTR